jgi:hypothetical protein
MVMCHTTRALCGEALPSLWNYCRGGEEMAVSDALKHFARLDEERAEG